ncbi:TPA: DUF5801 repeats-in-toxin domain-containing protein, partial [Escherichia coli]
MAGLATNLSSTAGGAITLYLEGGDLVGRDANGGDPVFTIKLVNVGTLAAPVYQLETTLYEALEHGNTSLFDEAVNLLLSADGTVQLKYSVTITDGDGDSLTKSATVDLISDEQSVVSFEDDGPALSVAASVSESEASALQVRLDESEGTDRAAPGETANGNGDDNGPGLAQVRSSVVGGLVSLFAQSGVSYGSDGEGSTVASLSF